MKQREVTDKDNIKWTCVQAYGGMQQKSLEKATELAENKEGTVTVVCTPSGGAQTVRLTLAEDWETALEDDALIELIAESGH